jgi:WbqC-like protein family.
MENSSQSLSESSYSLLLPSLFFPPIAYFQCLSTYGCAIIESQETFPKQTLRNRTYILTANGIESINVPIVREKSIRQTTSQVHICYKDHWSSKAWRAITSAYGQSPYFEYFENDIHKFFSTEYSSLWELNNAILTYFLQKLDLDTKISYTNDFIPPTKNQKDMRHVFSSQKSMANTFSQDSFIPYTQCFCNKFDFISNLSCLDLLFMNGNESSYYLKKISLL